MNTAKIELYNDNTKEYEDVTKYTVNDLKFANLLDEQLDEGTISLVKYPKDEIRPLTLIRVTVVNAPEAPFTYDMFKALSAESDYDGISISVDPSTGVYTDTFEGGLVSSFDPATKRITQTYTREYLIATDSAEETPAGSGKFNHELYFIELTQLLEGFIGDSISFTNPLGNNFVENT